MDNYRCGICKRDFKTASRLMRHANTMHQGRTTISCVNEQRFHDESSIQTPEYDETLWTMPIVNPSVAITQETNTPFSPSTPQVNDIDIEMEVDYKELPRYNLRSQAQNRVIEETIGESAENIETESQLPVTFRKTDCDPEDLQGASLDDALDTIEGKNKSKHITE
ncbi:hypothetical protein RclHR1_25110004 [Rhizophagus clarus]|uniref:C2H2-type domain-containing protein n=1 Tax=Rhizophagus clarus TaxID=94130 RepID=A0A2Z6RBP1_9GLOM|nr:hypothetical protein RclHR1_25110004 [Rhizophagus clarus]GES77015.1 hypothetical protein GLOIN_2v1764901 [Rhizophagus clarus]